MEASKSVFLTGMRTTRAQGACRSRILRRTQNHPSASQTQCSQCGREHVRNAGKPQPQLIGTHRRCAGAISEQAQRLFLNAIFHVAARTVFLFAKRCPHRIHHRRGWSPRSGDWNPWRDAPLFRSLIESDSSSSACDIQTLQRCEPVASSF